MPAWSPALPGMCPGAEAGIIESSIRFHTLSAMPVSAAVFSAFITNGCRSAEFTRSVCFTSGARLLRTYRFSPGTVNDLPSRR